MSGTGSGFDALTGAGTGAPEGPSPAPPAGIATLGPLSPSATRIVLIRHGEAVCNVSGVCGGPIGCLGLTDRGRAQVFVLVDRLSETGELAGADALYASILPRAVETAELLAPALRATVDAVPMVAIQECGFCELHCGEADGLDWTDFSARFGNPDWDTDPGRLIAPGGESWTGFVNRLPADLARFKLLGIDYDQVPFEPQAAVSLAMPGKVTAALSTEMSLGDVRYTTNGKPVTATSPVYGAPLTLPLNTMLKTQAFFNGAALGGEKTYALTQVNAETRTSFQLTQCTNSIVLALEDDYPVDGKRPVVLQDVMHPCWQWKGVDMSRGVTVAAHIANYPFNFQLAADLSKVVFDAPKTPEGELEVRLDSCTGPVALSLPIGKAANNPGLSLLSGQLPAMPGTHDVCFSFAQKTPKPEWALDDVRLSAR